MTLLCQPMTEMQALQEMLCELESHMLVTILAPSKRRDRRDHDMIRVNLDENPRWYRRLCDKHPSSRGVRRGKHDTKIKRRNVIALLTRLTSGLPARSKYEAEVRSIARGLTAK